MITEPKQLKEMVELAISKSRRLKEGILRSKWKEIAGELSKKSEVLYIKKGVLYVSAESSLWIQHLNFKKNELLERCNDILGGKYLVDMFFRAGKIKLEKHFLSEEIFMEDYDPEKIQLTPEEMHKIRESLDGVEDELIREKLFRLNVNSKKKEKFLLDHGYRICTSCHVLHNAQGDLCTICENKKKHEVQEKLFALFKERLEKKHPISYMDAKQGIADLSLEEFEQAKRKKLDKIYKDIWIYYRRKDLEELFDSCRKYFILELGIDDLTEVDTKVREYIERLNRGEISEG